MPFIRYNSDIIDAPNITGLYPKDPQLSRKNLLEVSNQVFRSVQDFPRGYCIRNGEVIQMRRQEEVLKDVALKKTVSKNSRNYDAENLMPIVMDGRTIKVDPGLFFRINLNLITSSDSMSVLEITATGLVELQLNKEEIYKLAQELNQRSEELIAKHGNM